MSETEIDTSVTEEQRVKGENLMIEAKQKLNEAPENSCKDEKYGEICDLFVKAGNAFKMAKEWKRAGEAFSEAACHYLENGKSIDAGMYYMEAAKCYRKVCLEECEKCLHKASEIYSDVGRGEIVAKHLLALAELNEEHGLLEKALKQYESAADMFLEEEIVSKRTQCLLGVATISANFGNFERAEEIFEQLGEQSLSNKLLKYTACEKFTKAGLCCLARNPQDVDALLQKIAVWRESCPSFAESRECKWLTKMALACQKQDIEAFNEAIKVYELTKLPKWEVNILKGIRKSMAIDLR